MSQNRNDLEVGYILIAIASFFVFAYVFSDGNVTPDYIIRRLFGWE